MTRLLALSLLLSAGATTAVAQECVEQAARSLGAEIVEHHEGFALPGRPEVFAYTYPAESCVAFLAVSRPAQDLDLQVLAPSGLELARDTASRAWAWSSHCGVAGQRVHATVRTPTRGRFALAVLRGAPPERPDLGRRVGACFAGEPGRATDAVDHRNPPEESRDLAGAVERVAVGLGWPAPRIEHGRLRGGRASATYGVEAGRCYLVVVRSTDATVVAEAVVGGERWRTPPHRRGVVRGCPGVDGTLEVFIGGGREAGYAIGVAELPRPEWAPPSSAGAAALAPAEGEPRVLARVHLRPGDRMPVAVEPSADCVSLAAVPADGDLSDLRLAVTGGPSDESPDAMATVHLCGSGARQVELRAARGTGTGWLVEWVR